MIKGVKGILALFPNEWAVLKPIELSLENSWKLFAWMCVKFSRNFSCQHPPVPFFENNTNWEETSEPSMDRQQTGRIIYSPNSGNIPSRYHRCRNYICWPWLNRTNGCSWRFKLCGLAVLLRYPFRSAVKGTANALSVHSLPLEHLHVHLAAVRLYLLW